MEYGKVIKVRSKNDKWRYNVLLNKCPCHFHDLL